MKNTFLATLALLILAAPALKADGPLPFTVKVGDQTATHKAGEPFAELALPVAPDASITLDVKSDMSIINAQRTEADGTTPDRTAPTAIIIFQGTNKGSLDQTMDKQKLQPGRYLLSIVADGRTATIKFQVK